MFFFQYCFQQYSFPNYHNSQHYHRYTLRVLFLWILQMCHMDRAQNILTRPWTTSSRQLSTEFYTGRADLCRILYLDLQVCLPLFISIYQDITKCYREKNVETCLRLLTIIFLWYYTFIIQTKKLFYSF